MKKDVFRKWSVSMYMSVCNCVWSGSLMNEIYDNIHTLCLYLTYIYIYTACGSKALVKIGVKSELLSTFVFLEISGDDVFTPHICAELNINYLFHYVRKRDVNV